MIHFFGDATTTVFVVETLQHLSPADQTKLNWLFGNQPKLSEASLNSFFIGPHAAIITPWSTNATEITQNMGIQGIRRIEKFWAVDESYNDYDPMLFYKYKGLAKDIFTVELMPKPIVEIDDIATYNQQQGLALNLEEIAYLEALAQKLGRKLTDSEVFGFSQVNSEHCRHKIFNGVFMLDGQEQPSSLFQLIKKTAQANPNGIVSAYTDNVAFLRGPQLVQFAPKSSDKPDYYQEQSFEAVLSVKAETHNFPTTVEAFNGSATGAGGEIRDRLAGGKGALPLAGTAVYMTAYSRLENSLPNSQPHPWEQALPPRKWLYQAPKDILIKASNGASDFGNKFGQPLIAGAVLTFEHDEARDSNTNPDVPARRLGFDKVIMLAGGVGVGKADQVLKATPQPGDLIVLLGGDNYRIGMGGAAVSSADTGAFSTALELNAVQRANPEMQKRVANTIRNLVEGTDNPIVSIHDHGAGGHLNCLSELVEATGGFIDLDQLPVGDPTLSAKELIGNESQERMGLIIHKNDLPLLQRIAARERTPLYVIGTVTGDHRFTFASKSSGEAPVDLALSDLFDNSPKTRMEDVTLRRSYAPLSYTVAHFHTYLEQVLQLEAVACKDWLTNKVDRCVGGRVAKQQCAGPLQLPLNNCGVMALDFKGKEGIATSIGHSPIAALIDPVAGSRNSITEALTNIIWAPLEDGLRSVSLSANWMWPCKNPGEDARLYQAVQAVSDFAIALGINIPTGKDSLSMKQKYKDGSVLAPGTVVISAVGHCNAITKVVEPVLQKDGGALYYINISKDSYKLGGSSFAQTRSGIGDTAPSVLDATYVKTVFNTVQELIATDQILAGHDVASGGLITTLLELCFADNDLGAELDLSALGEADTVKLLFAENAGIVFQAKDTSVEKRLEQAGITYHKIGTVISKSTLTLQNHEVRLELDVAALRDTWFTTSYLLDEQQTANGLAKVRYTNYKNQPLRYTFPNQFTGKLPHIASQNARPKAAVLREKGSNSERELANALYLAGFAVKDVHMTDLITGRETLEDIQFLGAVGGFSNSDVLGSAKGWAGAFRYNEKANKALEAFFARPDTLSIGICNGCQLFMELELIHPEHEVHGKMTYNDSQKHESMFTSVTLQENPSVMLASLAGTTLGVWISHGEGKFQLPLAGEHYPIVAQYGYESYPANPNGSDYNTAMLCDSTGRHLVTMPHIERSIFPWNWAHYSKNRTDAVSPWLQAFINARVWVERKK